MFIAMAGAVASYYLNSKIRRFIFKTLLLIFRLLFFTDYAHNPEISKVDIRIRILLDELQEEMIQLTADIECLKSVNNWELGAEREI